MIKKILTTIILVIMFFITYRANMLSAGSVSVYDSMGVEYYPDGMSTSICDGLIAVKKNSRWGYADINGRLVIPCQYNEVKAFKNGYAMIRINENWGVINTTGKLIINPQFSDARQLDLVDGYIRIPSPNGEMFFDKNGHEINLAKQYPGYDKYKRLSNDFIAVAKGQSWGIIDNTGRELIPPQYPSTVEDDVLITPPILINKNGIFGFIQNSNIQADNNTQYNSDDIYPIDKEFSGGIINKYGKTLVPFEYAIKQNRLYFRWFDLYFSDGLSPVQNIRDGKISYVDESGKIILTLDRSRLEEHQQPGPLYDFHSFSEGMCRVEHGNKWGFIDTNGKTTVTPQYDFVFNYRNGYSTVRAKNQKVGCIDKKGKTVIPIIYDSVSYFNNGMIVVCNKGKYGVLNTSGKTILPLIYNAPPAYDPSSELFIVKKGDKYGFVNKRNKIIIPIKYNAVTHFSNKLAKVKLGSYYGFINVTGNVVLPIKYKSLSNLVGNRIYAMDDGNSSYVLDIKGNVILKAKTSMYI